MFERARPAPPDAVLPFSVDRETAAGALSSWIRGRFLIPSQLRQVVRPDRLDGVYVPYWVYGADTVADYEGERGEEYSVPLTTSTTVNGQTSVQTTTTRHVSWEPAEGQVSHSFGNVQFSAVTRPSPVDLAEFAPWNLEGAVAYGPEEATGYEVLTANRSAEEGLHAARAAMAGVLERRCAQDIGGDQQRVTRVDTRFGDITRRTVLVPVWRAVLEYDDRKWEILLNGRTGDISGELPRSRRKVYLLTLVLCLAFVVWISLISIHYS